VLFSLTGSSRKSGELSTAFYLSKLLLMVEMYSWGDLPTTSLKQLKNGPYEENPTFIESDSKVFLAK
jgi:hypothetical protein